MLALSRPAAGTAWRAAPRSSRGWGCRCAGSLGTAFPARGPGGVLGGALGGKLGHGRVRPTLLGPVDQVVNRAADVVQAGQRGQVLGGLGRGQVRAGPVEFNA